MRRQAERGPRCRPGLEAGDRDAPRSWAWRTPSNIAVGLGPCRPPLAAWSGWRRPFRVAACAYRRGVDMRAAVVFRARLAGRAAVADVLDAHRAPSKRAA